MKKVNLQPDKQLGNRLNIRFISNEFQVSASGVQWKIGKESAFDLAKWICDHLEMQEYISDQVNKISPMLFKLRIETCKFCKSGMMREAGHGVFPQAYREDDQDAQMKRYGLKYESNRYQVCKECVADGQVTFECSLCNQRRPTNMIKELVGDPDLYPDYLCSVCFDTVLAKDWIACKERLEDLHRYEDC